MPRRARRDYPGFVADRLDRRQRLVLLIAILASFVAFLDGTVVNVALPAIARELGGGLVTQQWAVDAYLITLGALILLAGALSDALGRIVVLRAGLIGFALASVAVAAAPGPVWLIAARALQGMAGALLVPSSLALVTSTFRGAAQARAIGVWTAATTVAFVVGPVLGGVFVDLLSWRAVFLINVLPIGATLWLLAVLGTREPRAAGGTVDWPGALLCTAGLGGIVYALIEQDSRGWSSPAVWGTMAVGVISFVGFVVRQRFAARPMLPLSLFRARNFSAGNVATFFIYAALGVTGLVTTVYLQQGAHFSATLAGMAGLPSTVLLILLSSRVGTLVGRFGPRAFMTIGPTTMAVGALLLLSVSAEFDYWTQVLPALIVSGLGLTLTVAPLTSAVLGAIEPARSGVASATNNSVARVAGLLAVAMLGVMSGGTLGLAGLHRSVGTIAAMFALGAVASLVGISDRAHRASTAGDAEPAPA